MKLRKSHGVETTAEMNSLKRQAITAMVMATVLNDNILPQANLILALLRPKASQE